MWEEEEAEWSSDSDSGSSSDSMSDMSGEDEDEMQADGQFIRKVARKTSEEQKKSKGDRATSSKKLRKDGKPYKGRKDYTSIRSYIGKKGRKMGVHFNGKALATLENISKIWAQKTTRKANEINKHQRRNILMPKDLKLAIELAGIEHGQAKLSYVLNKAGIDAVTKYQSSLGKSEKKESKSEKKEIAITNRRKKKKKQLTPSG